MSLRHWLGVLAALVVAMVCALSLTGLLMGAPASPPTVWLPGVPGGGAGGVIAAASEASGDPGPKPRLVVGYLIRGGSW